MRLSHESHRSQPWRIHDLAPDFDVVDVYALPARGMADEFPRLLRVFSENGASNPVLRALFAARTAMGRLLHLDDDPGPDGDRTLRARLPPDLASGPVGPRMQSMRLEPVYLLADEWAAEVSNRVVHAVMHVGWVPAGDDRYQGQMAVLVKRRAGLGRYYMTAIAPFRTFIVYPLIMRIVRRRWAEHAPGRI